MQKESRARAELQKLSASTGFKKENPSSSWILVSLPVIVDVWFKGTSVSQENPENQEERRVWSAAPPSRRRPTHGSVTATSVSSGFLIFLFSVNILSSSGEEAVTGSTLDLELYVLDSWKINSYSFLCYFTLEFVFSTIAARNPLNKGKHIYPQNSVCQCLQYLPPLHCILFPALFTRVVFKTDVKSQLFRLFSLRELLVVPNYQSNICPDEWHTPICLKIINMAFKATPCECLQAAAPPAGTHGDTLCWAPFSRDRV